MVGGLQAQERRNIISKHDGNERWGKIPSDRLVHGQAHSEQSPAKKEDIHDAKCVKFFLCCTLNKKRRMFPPSLPSTFMTEKTTRSRHNVVTKKKNLSLRRIPSYYLVHIIPPCPHRDKIVYILLYSHGPASSTTANMRRSKTRNINQTKGD